jgi:titin
LLDDTSKYVCKAKNSIGETTVQTQLNVYIHPKYILHPEGLTEVKMGDNVEFSFKVIGFPLPQITFLEKLENKIIEFTEDSSYQYLETNKFETGIEYKFVIKSVTYNTLLSYECNASNIIGDCKFKFDLILLKTPEFILIPKNIINLVQNSDLYIECKVTSNPDAIITWFKNDSKIVSSKRIFINESKYQNSEKTSSIKIFSVDKDDAGSYVIVAKNKIGEAKSSTNVLVEFSPIITKDLKPKEKSCENSSFKFECIIIGNPMPDITW